GFAACARGEVDGHRLDLGPQRIGVEYAGGGVFLGDVGARRVAQRAGVVGRFVAVLAGFGCLRVGVVVVGFSRVVLGGVAGGVLILDGLAEHLVCRLLLEKKKKLADAPV